MTEPTTAAGRACLEQWDDDPEAFPYMQAQLLVHILAIEAEAHEQGMLRQLERQIHEESETDSEARQQDGSALKRVATALSLARSMILTREPMSEQAAAVFEEAFVLAALPPSAPAVLDVESWVNALAHKIARARFGRGLDMGGKHNPLPTERQTARQFVDDLLAALPPSAPAVLPRHSCRQGVEPCAACDAADAIGPSAPPALDVLALGLSAEQTTILREHLASRQQTVSEFLGDMLMDIGLGRVTGMEYPPPARLQEQDRPPEEPASP